MKDYKNSFNINGKSNKLMYLHKKKLKYNNNNNPIRSILKDNKNNINNLIDQSNP